MTRSVTSRLCLGRRDRSMRERRIRYASASADCGPGGISPGQVTGPSPPPPPTGAPASRRLALAGTSQSRAAGECPSSLQSRPRPCHSAITQTVLWRPPADQGKRIEDTDERSHVRRYTSQAHLRTRPPRTSASLPSLTAAFRETLSISSSLSEDHCMLAR